MFWFGLYGPFKNISLISSRLFIKGEWKPENPGKTTWPFVSRTWLSHMWHERDSNHISYHNRIFDQHAGTGATSTSVGPLPDSWIAARMADLTPDLQIRLSWGLIAESFHSLQSLFISCVHVILGLPGPRFPSTCMSNAVLTAPLERSTCPFHRSLLSFRMRSRSSMPSRTSSSLDLVVTMSCGLTLQICLIIALSFHCRRWRFDFVNGQVSLAWSIVLCTQELYTRPRVLKERWHEERTGSRSLNFFQVVFTHVVVESSQPPTAESMSTR